MDITLVVMCLVAFLLGSLIAWMALTIQRMSVQLEEVHEFVVNYKKMKLAERALRAFQENQEQTDQR